MASIFVFSGVGRLSKTLYRSVRRFRSRFRIPRPLYNISVRAPLSPKKKQHSHFVQFLCFKELKNGDALSGKIIGGGVLGGGKDGYVTTDALPLKKHHLFLLPLEKHHLFSLVRDG